MAKDWIYDRTCDGDILSAILACFDIDSAEAEGNRYVYPRPVENECRSQSSGKAAVGSAIWRMGSDSE